MQIGLSGSPFEEVMLDFLESRAPPQSSRNATVKSLEESVFRLSPSESGLLASKMFPYLLRTEIRLRTAYQFSPQFHNWLVRNVQPLIGDGIIDSVVRWIGPADTVKRKSFLLGMAVMLAPDLSCDEVDEEVRQEAESTFGVVGFRD